MIGQVVAGVWACGNHACRGLSQPETSITCLRCGALREGIRVAGIEGAYVVGAFHRAGGMGVIHRGVDLVKGLPVAIKTIRTDPSLAHDPDWQKARSEFVTEARMLQRSRAAQPDGLIKMIDFVDDPSRHILCIVMEFLDGENLHDFVRSARASGMVAVPEQTILRFAIQVGRALVWMRDNGIVHRDLNPVNIIKLAGSDRVVVIDFGTARLASTSRVTVMGKHGYLPLEQLQGQLSHASDIYAFGATLFFLTTGVDPSTQVGRLPRPSSVPGCTSGPDLDDLIFRCTHDAAADRPDSPEVVATIEQLLNRYSVAQATQVFAQVAPPPSPVASSIQPSGGSFVGSASRGPGVARGAVSTPALPPMASSLGSPASTVFDPSATVRVDVSPAGPVNPTVFLDDLAQAPTATLPVSADLLRRAAGLLVDFFGVGVVGAIFQLAAILHPDLGLAMALVTYFVWFAYAPIILGGTPGMRVVGLRLVTARGKSVNLPQAFVRSLGLLVSSALFGLGFIFALSGRKLTLHDHMSSTMVVRADLP